MLKIIENGNVFSAESGVVVIPVNCVGAAGAGLAMAMRLRYGTAARIYRKACRGGKFDINKILILDVPEPFDLLLLPTKDHWADPTDVKWLLPNIRRIAEYVDPDTPIHLPAVGCGLGNVNGEFKRAVDTLVTPETIMPAIKELAETHTVYFYQPNR